MYRIIIIIIVRLPVAADAVCPVSRTNWFPPTFDSNNNMIFVICVLKNTYIYYKYFARGFAVRRRRSETSNFSANVPTYGRNGFNTIFFHDNNERRSFEKLIVHYASIYVLYGLYLHAFVPTWKYSRIVSTTIFHMYILYKRNAITNLIIILYITVVSDGRRRVQFPTYTFFLLFETRGYKTRPGTLRYYHNV